MTAAPENNQKSIFLVPFLTAMVALGPISTDLYLPSLPSIGTALGASVSATQLTLSVFIAGMAIGTLIYGPLSDRFGRRPLILLGLMVFAAGSVGCAFAPTIGWLLFWRFVEAVGGSAAPVLARAIVRDLYSRSDAARVMSFMAAAMALAPAVAPIIGGWVHLTLGWRGHFWILTFLGIVATGLAWRLVAETNRQPDAGATRPARLARNIGELFRHRGFNGFMLTTTFSYSGLFSFISGGAFVVITVLGVAPENFGFLFIFAAFGFVAGGTLGGRITRKFGLMRMIEMGVWIGVAAGIAGLGLALADIATPVSVIAPVAVVFFSCAFVFPNATAGAIGPFPHMAGTASSVLGFVQMGTGAATGFLVGAAFNNTTVPLFAIITGAMILSLATFYTVAKPAERTMHV
ncbi:MAG: Bcr/CflA family multidrug efflux MFS transporter [Rhodobacteraceae bacterium]|nr:Bcr/CflA family multidrug efflux MFS transporter [Paracoccaceae bacterium]